MTYRVLVSTRFKKDLKRCEKRGLKMSLIYDAIETLRLTGILPPEYHPHKLVGNHAGEWECHITPDWLMIWEQNEEELTLLFMQTGTHSDIF